METMRSPGARFTKSLSMAMRIGIVDSRPKGYLNASSLRIGKFAHDWVSAEIRYGVPMQYSRESLRRKIAPPDATGDARKVSAILLVAISFASPPACMT